MTSARLIVLSPGSSKSGETVIVGRVSIGSAAGNHIRIPGADGSPHHARVDKREEAYWLVNLSGGLMSVNGEPVTSKLLLRDKDCISIGSDTKIVFRCDAPTPHGRAWDDQEMRRYRPPRSPFFMAGVSLIAVMLLLALAKNRPSDCGRVEILSPSPNTRTIEPVTLRVRVEKPGCVKQIIYSVGGMEVTRTSDAAAEVRIEPERLGLAIPGTYEVSAIVESRSGERKTAADVPLILVGEEVREDTPPTNSLSRERVSALSKKLAADIAPQSSYVFEDSFLDEIGKHIPDFQSETVARTMAKRSTIEQAFNNQAVPPTLGLAFAASLGKFENASIKELAKEVRSLQLLFNNKGADFMYMAACRGMKLGAVAQVDKELKKYTESDRHNFWLIKEQLRDHLPRDAGERVARLFAAGIVATNPQEFD